MKKHILNSFIVILVTATLLGAATQTINSLPVQNSAFIASLQAFLVGEPSARFQKKFAGFTLQGGIGATSASLSHTLTALTAFPGGYYVYKAATSHTYTASTRTFVYADYDSARTLTIAGAAITRSTHLVFAEMAAGSAEPTTPALTVRLMQVDTDGAAITAVSDLRSGGRIGVEVYTTLALAATNAPANSVIEVTRNERLAADVTLTQDLDVLPGGLVTCTGYILTLSGQLRSADALRQQFVAVAGEVVGLKEASVAWFGAIAGDAVDDSAAFGAASGAVTTAKGTVKVPLGSFIVGSWNPGNYVSVKGASMEGSIIAAPAAAPCVFLTTKWSYADVSDLTFAASSGQDCLTATTASTAWLSAMHFQRVRFQGPVAGGTGNFAVSGYQIINTYDDCYFGGLLATQKMLGAFYWSGAANNGNTHNNCKFYRHTGPVVKCVDANNYYTYGARFNDCIWENNDDILGELYRAYGFYVSGGYVEKPNNVSNANNCLWTTEHDIGPMVIENVIFTGSTIGYTTQVVKLVSGATEARVHFLRNQFGTNWPLGDGTGATVLLCNLLASDRVWYYGNNHLAGTPTFSGSATYSFYSDLTRSAWVSVMPSVVAAASLGSGTWTPVRSTTRNLIQITRTSANNTTEAISFDASPFGFHTYGSGNPLKITAIRIIYEVTNADAGDDITIQAYQRSIPANTSDYATSLVAIAATYDTAHNTPAKRSNSDGGTKYNTAVRTFDTPTFWATDGDVLTLDFTVTEADNASNALTVILRDVQVLYEER